MNDEIYMFNGKNITMNVCLQIRDVVHLIQKAYQNREIAVWKRRRDCRIPWISEF